MTKKRKKIYAPQPAREQETVPAPATSTSSQSQPDQLTKEELDKILSEDAEKFLEANKQNAGE